MMVRVVCRIEVRKRVWTTCNAKMCSTSAFIATRPVSSRPQTWVDLNHTSPGEDPRAVARARDATRDTHASIANSPICMTISVIVQADGDSCVGFRTLKTIDTTDGANVSMTAALFSLRCAVLHSECRRVALGRLWHKKNTDLPRHKRIGTATTQCR